MSEATGEKKKFLKQLIRKLHAGVSPTQIEEEFGAILGEISPAEMAEIEQELIGEGMSREEIQKFCDIHMAVFEKRLKKPKLDVAPEHPINILMEEHRILLQRAEKLVTISRRIQQAGDENLVDAETIQLRRLAEDFKDSEKHYLREENVLFPILEKHGITEPPAIMWTEHNQIREKEKNLHELLETEEKLGFQSHKRQLSETSSTLSEFLSSHFSKENNILFPTALRVISDFEWKEIKRDFDEIGYCSFTPSQLIGQPRCEEGEEARTAALTTQSPKGTLEFETGSLSTREVEPLLDSLPIDITFVGKDDTVKYFNKAEKRLFVRTKAIIGRKVQLCHPQKSIHIVNKIVEAFKTGKKNVAEFWINMNERLIYIRYFAVRDKNGEYLGTMEVTQDITDVKKISGEKRLLDWKQE